MNTLVRFAKDEFAATAIEYCIIASLISIVIVVAVNGVGIKVECDLHGRFPPRSNGGQAGRHGSRFAVIDQRRKRQ